ncbi:MAG: ABC transporter ATP-binding protein [Chloroflexi bacterium]|nr:ABC transporter ATP-binding protein [Chloroflexota bacterium]
MTTNSSVRMAGIKKRFPGVLANDQIDFVAYPGEIHALLGENGAGKSTLMNILFGIYQPDEGEISLHGHKVQFRSPRDAIAQGIGMVHQHFMLVEVQTVAENVTLGLNESRFLLNLGKTRTRIAELAQKYGLQVDADAHIWQLSVGEQQRVEILKMLYRGADILILDEPTAVLTPQEVRDLFSTLRRMACEGHTVIFITHKLDEVMAIADRITVLCGGRVVSTVKTPDTSKELLAKMMVGRPVLLYLEKQPVEKGEIVLQVENIQALSDKRMPALKGVSFTVQQGEIFGIAGVAGNGQRELAEVITGLRPASGGRVLISNVDVTNCTPCRIIQKGVGHIPEDRTGMGLVPNLAVSDNIILKAYRQPTLTKGPFLKRLSIRAFVDRLIKLFNIATPSQDTPVKQLSGGNLQRTILAREISAIPSLLVAVHPTRGLDIGATEAVHKMLLEQRSTGAAILLISEDLDEVLTLSDRVATLYEGQIMGIVPAEKANVEELGLMMGGTPLVASASTCQEGV